MADNDRAWLAGLLEGEGCFALRSDKHNPIIQLVMTDKDIVIRAAIIMKAHRVTQGKTRTKGGLLIYRTVVYGETAVNVMKEIFEFMGERRKAKIIECIETFAKHRTRRNVKSVSRGADIVWRGGDLPSQIM